MATWDDFFPHVLPLVRGCDPDVATHHIRQAAIEFCKRSQAWRAELAGLTSTADTEAYPLVSAIPVGSTISKLLSLAVVNADGFGDTDYALASPGDGRVLDRNYSFASYAYLSDDRATLYIQPVPTEDGLSILPYVSLKPTQASVTFPDVLLESYAGTIAAGALASLLSMPKVDWRDQQSAAEARMRFMVETASAAGLVSRGFARSKQRTAGFFF